MSDDYSDDNGGLFGADDDLFEGDDLHEKTASSSTTAATTTEENATDVFPKEKKLVYKDMNAQGMKLIFDREEYSDFKIVLKQLGRTVYVYKGILAARSEFFKALIESGFAEKDNHMMEVDDESEEKALLLLLEFCYTGEITVAERDVLPYYFIADKYQVLSLKSKCSDFIVGNLKSENALDR